MFRTILTALLLASACVATAQRVRTWEAQVEHPDPEVSPKPVFAGIMQGLPGSDLQFVRKIGVIMIVTDINFEIPWLEAVITDAGFTLVGLRLDGMDLYAEPEEDNPAELLVPAPVSSLAQPMNSTPDE